MGTFLVFNTAGGSLGAVFAAGHHQFSSTSIGTGSASLRRLSGAELPRPDQLPRTDSGACTRFIDNESAGRFIVEPGARTGVRPRAGSMVDAGALSNRKALRAFRFERVSASIILPARRN